MYNSKNKINALLSHFKLFDKLIIIYLFTLFFFLSFTFHLNSLLSDEGTHLLLSAFYKDLIIQLIKTSDFSFNNAYKYGISYLVTYPKLQIAYPPLYHTTTFLSSIFFGTTEFTARLVNLTYSISSFGIFYLIIKKFFDSKIAFFSTFLFSFSPFALFLASRVLTEFTVLFWFLVSIYLFIFAIQTKKIRFFALTGFSVFLTALGKQMGAFIIFFFLIILLENFFNNKSDRKKIIKFIFVMLICFFIPLLPYLIILVKINGFEINKLVSIGGAYEQGEPTSYLNILFWTWYLIEPLKYFPFMLIFLLLLFLYVYKKKPYFKKILLFFIIFYFLLTLIPNKETKFVQFFMLPAYLTSAYYISKLNFKLIVLFSIFYAIVSLYLFSLTVYFYPIDQVAKYIKDNIPEEGNVALLSEKEPLFSSSLMWNLFKLDKDHSIRIYRSCMFNNKTRQQILELLDNNNIYFVVQSLWDDNTQIKKIEDKLNIKYNITKDALTTNVYSYKKFNYKPTKKCNFICLTEQPICVD